MKEYRALEKAIVAKMMDLSLRNGPVEIQLTEETEEEGFIPSIIVRTAPDGVLRGLVEDERIADLSMKYGELHVAPAPEWMDKFITQDGTATKPATPCKPWPMLNKDLTLMPWDEIAAAGAAGTAPRDLGLGSTKPFTLATGETLVARIIDFDHDQLADEPGLAPITWELLYPMIENQPMNDTRTNKGGWAKSDLRAWLNGGLWDLLPEDLRRVIKPVVKQTAAGGKDPNIVETKDRLFIKSERELTGRCFFSHPGEGRQYALYAAEGVSWAMKTSTGRDAWPWLRGPHGADEDGFCWVRAAGTPEGTYATDTYDVAFCFCT